MEGEGGCMLTYLTEGKGWGNIYFEVDWGVGVGVGVGLGVVDWAWRYKGLDLVLGLKIFKGPVGVVILHKDHFCNLTKPRG